MATQIVMDHTGDTRHYFDANDAQAFREAEERFEKLTGDGFTAAVAQPLARFPESRRLIRPQKKHCSSRGLSAVDELHCHALVSQVLAAGAPASSILARTEQNIFERAQ